MPLQFESLVMLTSSSLGQQKNNSSVKQGHIQQQQSVSWVLQHSLSSSLTQQKVDHNVNKLMMENKRKGKRTLKPSSIPLVPGFNFSCFSCDSDTAERIRKANIFKVKNIDAFLPIGAQHSQHLQ